MKEIEHIKNLFNQFRTFSFVKLTFLTSRSRLFWILRFSKHKNLGMSIEDQFFIFSMGAVNVIRKINFLSSIKSHCQQEPPDMKSETIFFLFLIENYHTMFSAF